MFGLRARARTAPPTTISVVHTLPPSVSTLIGRALEVSHVDPVGIALHVRRHGIMRVFYTRCGEPSCRLVRNVGSHVVEGAIEGPGHLYRRKRDLTACRSGQPIVRVDRTRFFTTGRAYDGVPSPGNVPRGTTHVVTMKVPQVVPEGLLPTDRTYHRAKTAGATRIEQPCDDIVFVLGHELTHVEQYRTGRPVSEVEAELAGRAMLQRWVAAGRPGAPPATPARAGTA